MRNQSSPLTQNLTQLSQLTSDLGDIGTKISSAKMKISIRNNLGTETSKDIKSKLKEAEESYKEIYDFFSDMPEISERYKLLYDIVKQINYEYEQSSTFDKEIVGQAEDVFQDIEEWFDSNNRYFDERENKDEYLQAESDSLKAENERLLAEGRKSEKVFDDKLVMEKLKFAINQKKKETA